MNSNPFSTALNAAHIRAAALSGEPFVIAQFLAVDSEPALTSVILTVGEQSATCHAGEFVPLQHHLSPEFDAIRDQMLAAIVAEIATAAGVIATAGRSTERVSGWSLRLPTTDETVADVQAVAPPRTNPAGTAARLDNVLRGIDKVPATSVDVISSITGLRVVALGDLLADDAAVANFLTAIHAERDRRAASGLVHS